MAGIIGFKAKVKNIPMIMNSKRRKKFKEKK